MPIVGKKQAKHGEFGSGLPSFRVFGLLQVLFCWSGTILFDAVNLQGDTTVASQPTQMCYFCIAVANALSLNACDTLVEASQHYVELFFCAKFPTTAPLAGITFSFRNLTFSMAPSLLSETTVPGLYRCLDVVGDGDDALRLKRLGVCAGRKIEVMRTGDPMVLNAVGAQIGVSRLAAHLVTVERIADLPAALQISDGHSNLQSTATATGANGSVGDASHD